MRTPPDDTANHRFVPVDPVYDRVCIVFCRPTGECLDFLQQVYYN